MGSHIDTLNHNAFHGVNTSTSPQIREEQAAAAARDKRLGEVKSNVSAGSDPLPVPYEQGVHNLAIGFIMQS